MINFSIENDLLLLHYNSERSGIEWVFDKLESTGKISLRRTFYFTKNDLYEEVNSASDEFYFDEVSTFILGRKENQYYKIEGEKLGINISVFIHGEVKLYEKSFTAEKSISIFKKIEKIINEDIYIGGEGNTAIHEDDFTELLSKFPNVYELEKYVHARIGSILINYFDSAVDTEKKYNVYMNKKESRIDKNLSSMFRKFEIDKFRIITEKLQEMLINENSYSEKQWQNEIVQIILFLHPKYIAVFPEAPVRDTYQNKNRSVDFLLVDSGGSVDIVEIKKPFDTCIVTNRTYRDNYMPLRELSGTVMQIEKYIFYLNKWGRRGEDSLTEKYKDKLPNNLKINVTNPKGIIIMGREHNLSPNQKSDFEVIKRKYNNIIDIMTYDNLIKRLKFTIEQLEKST